MGRLGASSLSGNEVAFRGFQRTFQGFREKGMMGYVSRIVSTVVLEVRVGAYDLTIKQNVNHCLPA